MSDTSLARPKAAGKRFMGVIKREYMCSLFGLLQDRAVGLCIQCTLSKCSIHALILCFRCAYFAMSGELRGVFTLAASWLLARVMFFLLQNNPNFALYLPWACICMIVGCLQPRLLSFMNSRPETN